MGLKLVRSRRPQSMHSERFADPCTRGLQVECIGPSGVGKTTIVQLFRNRARFGWLFEYPAQSSSKPNLDAENGRGELYKRLLVRKSQSILAQEYSADHSLALIAFYISRLQQDLKLLQSGHLNEAGTWWDDGIVRIFTDELHEELRENPDLIIFFESRVVVNCVAPVEMIIDRLAQRSRSKPNAMNDWYAVHGQDAIHGYVEAGLARKRRFLDLWQALGGEAYTLDLSEQESALSEMLRIEERIVSSRT